MREVAKGVELQRLNDQDCVQAEGPFITCAPFFCIAAGFDVPLPPIGFVNRGKGTEEVRLRRSEAARHVLPPARSLDEVSSIPASLGPQRAILVAFGGRRRKGDIISHLQSFVDTHEFKHVPTICVLDLVHGEAHDAALWRGHSLVSGDTRWYGDRGFLFATVRDLVNCPAQLGR